MTPEEVLNRVETARARLEDGSEGAMVPPSVSLPGAVPVASPSQSLPVPGKTSYTLAELCRFDGVEFVENAFFCLVGRAAALEERQEFVSMLAHGEVKPWILGEILRRIAGRPLGMVPGLRVRYVLQRVYRVPLVGGFMGWSVNLLRLSEVLRHQPAVLGPQGLRHWRCRHRAREDARGICGEHCPGLSGCQASPERTIWRSPSSGRCNSPS